MSKSLFSKDVMKDFMEAVQTISLDEIDLGDDTFSVNFKPDLRKLRASIESVGLIEPILLRRQPKGFQIVCGFRRVAVLGELRISRVEARVSEEVEDLKLFVLALHDNFTTRSWNAVEKAVALDKLVHRFRVDRARVIRQFLPLFDLETNEKILETFLALARMEDELKEFVLREEVSRSNIRRFGAFSEEDRKAVLTILYPLKWGENSLREVLTLLEEVAQKDGVTIKQVTESPEIKGIVAQEGLPSPQKVERLKKVLWGMRYPRRNRLEEEFERSSRSLCLPPNIKLFPAPHFEEKSLGLQIRFRTLKEFRSALDRLSRVVDQPSFRSLLERFGDEG